ncbi:hypothetical protein ETD86_30370 [Nonomuraea turkmeniaca]|uniref:Uncharacterized protein n=1 Tax=Nonomuraea turkmeniaca TaxID=103838 RepID=A0A5S4FU64_9ACTN|nr:hypothetical protein [Nonomuraea turkmeniaca]TMR13595.1 hypothetical protein ETD86_30370 [Nonomuraea turkmeniaca]
MDDIQRTIDRLVADIAPDPGPGMTPLARELFEEITTASAVMSARPRGRRRRWFAVPVVAVLAATAVVLGWVLPGALGSAPASAALDIKREGGYYVITVEDLFADPDMYQSELKARGLDITLELAPTSASMAGRILVINSANLLKAGKPAPADGPVKTIDAPGPCHHFAGCPIGVKVPVGYQAQAEIVLGREARPGEKYKIPPGIGLPGEPLHCVDYVNKTVAELVPMLRERGVEAEFVSYTQGVRPADTWYVHDGVMSAAGMALLVASTTLNPTPRPLDATCAAGS